MGARWKTGDRPYPLLVIYMLYTLLDVLVKHDGASLLYPALPSRIACSNSEL
jgi:hypothetical protein